MKILTDANGNTASVEYWGSEEAAQKALNSLRNCSRCSDCFDCFGCFGCSDKNKDGKTAMLIYDASDPDYRINPARFFDSDKAALSDMKRLAEKESK